MNNLIPNNNFFDLNNDSNNILESNKNYDTIVIKPPAKAITHGNKYVKLFIDSRQRDIVKYPNPASYVYELEEEFIDILSVELLFIQIPNGFFNIYKPLMDSIKDKNGNVIREFVKTEGNNLMYISVDDKEYIAEIPEGNYNKKLLLDTLNLNYGNLKNYISTNDKKTKVIFNENPINNNVDIISNLNFTFNFNYINNKCNPNLCSNIDKILGFKPNLHISKEVNVYFKDNTEAIPILNSSNDPQYNFQQAYHIKNINVESVFIDTDLFTDSFFIYNNVYVNLMYYDSSNNLNSEIIYILKYSKDFIIFNFYDSNKLITIPPNNIKIKNINYNFITSNNAINIKCLDYFILDIPEFHLIQSNTKPLWNSFSVISSELTDCKTVWSRNLEYAETKYFNPPLPRLSKLNINFKNYENRLFNFNGKDHYIIFKIITLNQPQKYNNYINPKI